YTVARGEARKAALDASLCTSLGKGLSFGLLGRLAEDQIGTVAIGQGSSLYASSFPLPQQLPDYVERGTLRDRHSRDLWIMIEFKDESRANFFSDLDPHVIDELYAEAEGKTSRVNGFRASKLRSHGKLFEALGARRVTPSRAKGYPSGQIVFAEFSLD